MWMEVGRVERVTDMDVEVGAGWGGSGQMFKGWVLGSPLKSPIPCYVPSIRS